MFVSLALFLMLGVEASDASDAPKLPLVTFALGNDRSMFDHEDDTVFFLEKNGNLMIMDHHYPLSDGRLAALVRSAPRDIRLVVTARKETSVVQLVTLMEKIQKAANRKLTVYIKTQDPIIHAQEPIR
jgi:hypothetical protein